MNNLSETIFGILNLETGLLYRVDNQPKVFSTKNAAETYIHLYIGDAESKKYKIIGLWEIPCVNFNLQ